MKKLLLFFVLAVFLLAWVPLPALMAAESPEKEIDWIGSLPGVKSMVEKGGQGTLRRTYTCGGDLASLMKTLTAKLKEKGWTTGGPTSVSVAGVEAHTLKATKGKMSLAVSLNSNPATAPLLSVMLTAPGGGSSKSTGQAGGGSGKSSAAGSGSGKISTGATGKNTTGSGNPGKGYREVSGSVMDTLSENITVPAGKELNLMGNLNGNMVVQKGAKAKIMANVNGNVTNHGTLDIMGVIHGDVINKGGVVNNMGQINGELKE